MKRIITLLLATVMIFVLSSCESENVKNAKAAYNEGKYSEVVELLSQEEDLSDSSKDMLTVSEANVLFENKDYVGAVKKLVTSSKGTQEDQYEEMFKAALDASNPKTLQYLMGHSDIGVTMNTYTHLGLDDAVMEIQRLQEQERVLGEFEEEEKGTILKMAE